MTTKLAIDHMSVTSDSQLLVDDVSLSLTTGEVVALIGASGSGKSITCSAALGVLPYGLQKIEGKVHLDHKEMSGHALRGHYVSTIMQNPRSAFNPLQTMLAHGIETLKIAGTYHKHSAKQRIASSMQDAGLDHIDVTLKLYPHEMSGGMLQRMMIALAMLSQTPFLFADEPTTDLDLVMQAKILDLLESLVKQQQLGILLITHDMGVVARLAHRAEIIHHGKIIENLDIMTLFSTPKHAVTRDLVNAHLSLYEMELPR